MPETRVDKYRELRAEIQSSNEDGATTKAKTSKKVSEMLDANDSKNVESLKNSTLSISYDNLMEAYDLYDKKQKPDSNPLDIQKKKKIAFIATIVTISVLITAGIIVVGILAFGGKI